MLSSPLNGVDPLDPSVSGGDHYDLADFGVSEARYVRITDRVDLVGVDGVFDLDAVRSAASARQNGILPGSPGAGETVTRS